MLESVFQQNAAGETIMDIRWVMLSLVVSIVLGMLISIAYVKTSYKHVPSQGFALTLVMLPAVVNIIIMLVGSNVARAFSLAGAFSIIRFRSSPGSPKNITYVLFTMAVGLSCGMGYILYAAIMALVLCSVFYLLERFDFGNISAGQKALKITVPEDLNYKDAFTPVLKRYTQNYRLEKLKTSNLGSLYELEYTITMRKYVDEQSMIDDLRVRNGNLNITLVMKAADLEF